jgi:hypothetical protein
MIKHLFVALLTCLFLTACYQNSYKIVGTVQGLDEGDTIFLSNDIHTGLPSDTAIVSEGGFTLKGRADSAVLGILYAAKQPDVMTNLFLEPGTIHIYLSTNPQHTKVSGTDANDALQEANFIAYMYGEKMKELVTLFSDIDINNESGTIARYQMESLKRDMSQKIISIAEQNLDNEFGYLIIANLEDDEMMPHAKRIQLIRKMPQKFLERPAIISLSYYPQGTPQ